MTDYRVKVETFGVIRAISNSDARAKAELAVRQAVTDSYRSERCPYWAETVTGFGLLAKKAERYESGVNDD